MDGQVAPIVMPGGLSVRAHDVDSRSVASVGSRPSRTRSSAMPGSNASSPITTARSTVTSRTVAVGAVWSGQASPRFFNIFSISAQCISSFRTITRASSSRETLDPSLMRNSFRYSSMP